MKLAGIDLAWKSRTKTTALAIGTLDNRTLSLTDIAQDLTTVESIIDCLDRFPGLAGIAIDAPLRIENDSGQRQCETLIGKEYGSRKAACHTSNRSLYPEADSVRLSKILFSKGFLHLGSTESKWQIECYPHPALIELFGLNERHKYKKGRVVDRKRGQCEFADLLLSLTSSKKLALSIPDGLSQPLVHSYIEGLSGASLKRNEDILDAIVCLYVSGLYAIGVNQEVFGNAADGYIYVPRLRCA